MSIQSEINRISGNVANALTAIANKGVTIPADSNSDDLATLIGQIQQGGGGTGAISIVDTPDAAGGTVRTITAVDISDTTAVAADVSQGKYFYTAAGVKTAGTASGGGGGSVEPKQVNFIDYDGSILYAYTAQEANALSALPANPSHSGLTAQGWNWALPQIKAQLTAMPDAPVWVGQMYVTQSGDTEIDCVFTADALHPYMGIGVNGTVTIKWGDGATSTLTGTNTGVIQWTDHVYASAGSYTVSINATNQFEFQNASSQQCGIFSNTNSTTRSREYSRCVKAIRMGTGYSSNFSYRLRKCINLETFTIPSYITGIGEYAFGECYHLKSVTIPSGVTSIGNSAFNTCYNLKLASLPSSITTIGNYALGSCYALQSITIPSGTTSIGDGAFQYCYVLKSVTTPSGLTSIGTSIFQNCGVLESATIQSGPTRIGNNMFSNCYSLKEVALPSGMTSIGTGAFQYCYALTSITMPSSITTIGSSAFNSCYALTSITIPSEVTTIQASTFASDYSVGEYHFLATTPPTLDNTNAFSSIQSYCVIYVPAASLTAYQTATNWSTYASYMQGE